MTQTLYFDFTFMSRRDAYYLFYKNYPRGDYSDPESLEYQTFCQQIRKKGVKGTTNTVRPWIF